MLHLGVIVAFDGKIGDDDKRLIGKMTLFQNSQRLLPHIAGHRRRRANQNASAQVHRLYGKAVHCSFPLCKGFSFLPFVIVWDCSGKLFQQPKIGIIGNHIAIMDLTHNYVVQFCVWKVRVVAQKHFDGSSGHILAIVGNLLHAAAPNLLAPQLAVAVFWSNASIEVKSSHCLFPFCL